MRLDFDPRSAASAVRLAPTLRRCGRTEVMERGRRFVYFAGCDYFCLSSHARVLKAARAALARDGLNVAASRLTTGNHPCYQKLEAALAAYFAVPHALLTSTGYLTNLAVAQASIGRFTHALIDERAHGCLQTAVQLLGANVIPFPHRQPAVAARLAQETGRGSRLVLLTDGMFAHDGSLAPLAEYRAALPQRSWLWVDDAHGAGVLGANGRGALEQAGVRRDRVVQTGTLSKAFGSYGGYILAPPELLAAIPRQSSSFIGSTPLPPPLAAAALTGLTLLRHFPEWRHRLLQRAAQVRTALQAAGWAASGGPGPIIPLIPASAAHARALGRRLRAAGIHPPLIHYPGGVTERYFRIVISSQHPLAQLRRLVDVFGFAPKTE